MRPAVIVATLVAMLGAAAPAFADVPRDGYLVFKTVRGTSHMEYRGTTGHVVHAAPAVMGEPGSPDPCRDPSYVFAGPKWKKFERYVVNAASAPSHVSRLEALRDLVASHEAWEKPFTTDCPRLKVKSKYRAHFGGLTNRNASLVAELRPDGVNAVAFQSLAGTVCDGAAACVVAEYRDMRFREADMALEVDLTRYGFADYWTTDDLTAWNDVGGQWAVSDVATHEFGHWAGLGHVDASPALTMFTFVHDGSQTLGLGDMLGVAALYGSRGRDDDD